MLKSLDPNHYLSNCVGGYLEEIGHFPLPLVSQTWALQSKSGTGASAQLHAVGDACEACYKLWKHSFEWMAWETLCGLAKDPNSEIHEAVKTSKAVLAGDEETPKPFKESCVDHHQGVLVCVRRRFKCLSELELRKALGKDSKLNKATTQKIPLHVDTI